MTPTYCGYHYHFTDGPCAAGKRTIDRRDVTLRITDIDQMLDDDELSQSIGYLGRMALTAEKAQLEVLRETVFR